MIRDILHQARRPLPLPCAGLAGAGAGRDLRHRGRRRHPRLQRADRRRLGAAPRPDHRRPRRRKPRGSLGLQRGDRRPRRGGEHHPAHLRGRARDRLDHHRPRRRSPRADPDRSRRARRAGARRSAHPGDELRLARHELPQAAGRGAADDAARARPRTAAAKRDPGPAASALRRGEREVGPRAARQRACPSRRARALGHAAQAASCGKGGARRARAASPP